MSATGSLLALLHPDGRAGTTRGLGRASAPLLGSDPAPAAGRVDLVVVAPSGGDEGRSPWLVHATREAVDALAPEGVLYALVPRRRRRQARRLLERAGLSVEVAVAHVPRGDAPRYLVPLTRSSLCRLPALVRARTRLARAARLASASRLSSLLALALPSVALVARRPGSRPLFDWIRLLDPALAGTVDVIVQATWRRPVESAVLYPVDGVSSTPVVVKVALSERVASRHAAEAALLDRLGDAARAAGADVPRVLAARPHESGHLLVETAVAARSAAVLLAAHPHRLPEIAEVVAAWLLAWNRATAEVTELDEERLERDVLVPLERLAPLLVAGERYRAWLRERCSRLRGAAVPLVAAHNDLTAWNLFLEGPSPLAVVDWETASERALPSVDFAYAVVDLAAAATRYRNRTTSFDACFAPGGRLTQLVERLGRRSAAALRVAPEVGELCFHACWLHHAANEQEADLDPGRPFLQIVQRLALRTPSSGAEASQ